MERIIESFEEFKKLNEKKIEAPAHGFTKKDVENILKTNKDLAIYFELAKDTYYIAPYMHTGGKLEKGTDSAFFPVNKSGKAIQMKFKDISYITV